jgi:hypothetical protein
MDRSRSLTDIALWCSENFGGFDIYYFSAVTGVVGACANLGNLVIAPLNNLLQKFHEPRVERDDRNLKVTRPD